MKYDILKWDLLIISSLVPSLYSTINKNMLRSINDRSLATVTDEKNPHVSVLRSMYACMSTQSTLALPPPVFQYICPYMGRYTTICDNTCNSGRQFF